MFVFVASAQSRCYNRNKRIKGRSLIRFFFLMILVVFLINPILVKRTHAQIWDNKWFKLKGRAFGYVVKEDGDLARTRFSGTSYILMQWNLSRQRYDLQHWVRDRSGTWFTFNGILPSPVGTNEVLWRDIYTRLQKNDDWIWVYGVARLRLGIDDTGSIKRARFVTIGCESPMGSVHGLNFGGKCKLRGKMVDAEDLPFKP